jgi:hypothetical protein
MSILFDFAHWALHDGIYPSVVVSAVILALLARRVETRSMRRYDAWWFHHTPGSSRLLRW